MGELDRLLELRRKLKAQLKDGACRKSSSEVLMVKSAEKSPKYNPAGGMDGTRQCGTFIDWRGLPIAHAAALALGLTPLNLVVGRKRTPAWEVSTVLNMSCCRFSRRGSPHISTTFLLASEAAI